MVRFMPEHIILDKKFSRSIQYIFLMNKLLADDDLIIYETITFESTKRY